MALIYDKHGKCDRKINGDNMERNYLAINP
jgi:hypothetical protein